MTSRNLVSVPTTWYVDNVSGSDSNDGSSPALAFLTLAAAFDRVLGSSDFSAQPTFRLLTTGVPYPRIVLPNYVGSLGYTGGYEFSFPRIVGDPANNSAVLLSPAPMGQPTIVGCLSSPWSIESLKIESSDSWAIEADNHARVFTRFVNFGNCHSGHMVASYRGFIELRYDLTLGGMDISGSTIGGYHMLANYGGMIVAQGNLVRINNYPSFAWFAGASNLGQVEAGGYVPVAYTPVNSAHPGVANVDAATYGVAHPTSTGWP